MSRIATAARVQIHLGTLRAGIAGGVSFTHYVKDESGRTPVDVHLFGVIMINSPQTADLIGRKEVELAVDTHIGVVSGPARLLSWGEPVWSKDLVRFVELKLRVYPASFPSFEEEVIHLAWALPGKAFFVDKIRSSDCGKHLVTATNDPSRVTCKACWKILRTRGPYGPWDDERAENQQWVEENVCAKDRV